MSDGILACDPGIRGAFGWTNGDRLAVRDMPITEAPVNGKVRDVLDRAGVVQILRSVRLRADRLIIERVGGMPGQSGPAAFTFGFGAGFIHGAAMELGFEVETVEAPAWKSALKVPASKRDAIARASELWPDYKHLWPLQKHDGRAEAAMIALYAWQIRGTL